VIKFMNKKSIKIDVSHNLVLYLIIYIVIFTYNVCYVVNFNKDLSVTTFNSKLSYESSKSKLLSFISNERTDETSFDFVLENKEFYNYCLNKTQAKHINLYNTQGELEKQLKTAHLPDEFKYKVIDQISLREFLKSRGSILSEEPYFSVIINTSKDFNLNPLLLFAIAGQEQSFVPKESKNAVKIANNPYNVFNSWQNYNTDIEDSSRIASRTVINLSKDRPSNIDLFIWINRKYSEDKDWHYGVRSIYEQLKTYTTFF
jgi:hypothetical protein